MILVEAFSGGTICATREGLYKKELVIASVT